MIASVVLALFSCQEYNYNAPEVIPYGSGKAPPLEDRLVLDEFLVPSLHPVDILFVVDRSCSMVDDAASINFNLPTFIRDLDSLWLDYRVGVISTDGTNASHAGLMGEYDGRTWIQNSDLDAAVLFSNLMGSVGLEGESGGDALLAWLEGEQAYDFLRYQVPLEIVFISDESDQSVSRPQQAAATLQLLQMVMDAPVRVSAIVQFPTMTLTCLSDAGIFSSGDDYLFLADTFNGVSLEICHADWAKDLSDLLPYEVPTSEFFLSQRPDPTSVDVLIYSDIVTFNPQPANLHYDLVRNSLSIVDFPVPADATVTIGYIVENQ